MRLTIIICLLGFSGFISTGQVVENFSDGNLQDDPFWTGDLGSFMVEDGILHLHSSGSGECYLSTQIQTKNEYEWRFWTELDFNPSSNNQLNVYLLSSDQDIGSEPNGFFLKVGESGSNDPVELLFRDNNTVVGICESEPGFVAEAFQLFVKVRRTQEGEWILLGSPSGFSYLDTLATGIKQDWYPNGYLGIVCKFTSSNAQRFHFDDIYAGTPISDTVKPFLVLNKITSPNHLTIQFSERVNEEDATLISNYRMQMPEPQLFYIEKDEKTHGTYHLFFSDYLQQCIPYSILINNIRDFSNNVMLDTIIEFILYEAQFHDVIINEIMANPNPSQGLPETEYIEVYNNTNFPLDLDNWKIKIGSKYYNLPPYKLKTNDYLIVSNNNYLIDYGNIVEVFNSGFSLNNTSAEITLYDKYTRVIHNVTYNSDWFEDSYKADGGWSLEMIDPNNACAGNSNWKGSIASKGGTPGERNSVYQLNPDHKNPFPHHINYITSKKIELVWSEPMDSISLQNPDHYLIQPGSFIPDYIQPVSPHYQSVILHFSTELSDTVTYSITLLDTLIDCHGNYNTSSHLMKFAKPQIIFPNDIVINEVLTDPREGGVDFVEIYNRSNKTCSLHDLLISDYDTLTKSLIAPQMLCEKDYLILPSKYLVLCSDSSSLNAHYIIKDPVALLVMKKFPAFKKEHCCITLLSKGDHTIIDQLNYNESMHFELLSDAKGVTLERVHFHRQTSDPTNWHSASTESGYGTPGYINSQFGRTINKTDILSTEPNIFSPNNDGRDDYITIQYNLSEPGFSGKISIFDASGNFKIRLLDSYLGMKGEINWDGTDGMGQLCSQGIYIVYFEAFSMKGIVVNDKTTCVLWCDQ